MTPTSHNRVLGILHLAYAGLIMLMMAVMSLFMLAMMSRDLDNRGEAPPIAFLALIAIVMVLVTLFNALPSFLAGYALLKRKRWAKTMALIAAIVAGMGFPLGSALCVFTLYFLFSESGRLLYPQAAGALPSGDASWAMTKSSEPERVYVPPSTPPDWR